MTVKNPLAEFKFFSDVNPDTVESIARKGEVVEYKAADVIFVSTNRPRISMDS